MRKLYVIREITSGAWCSSSRHATFHTKLDEAAIFNQRANAEKAIRDMKKLIDRRNRYSIYDGGTKNIYYALHNPQEGEVQSPGFGMTVVECNLIPNGITSVQEKSKCEHDYKEMFTASTWRQYQCTKCEDSFVQDKD